MDDVYGLVRGLSWRMVAFVVVAVFGYAFAAAEWSRKKDQEAELVRLFQEAAPCRVAHECFASAPTAPPNKTPEEVYMWLLALPRGASEVVVHPGLVDRIDHHARQILEHPEAYAWLFMDTPQARRWTALRVNLSREPRLQQETAWLLSWMAAPADRSTGHVGRVVDSQGDEVCALGLGGLTPRQVRLLGVGGAEPSSGTACAREVAPELADRWLEEALVEHFDQSDQTVIPGSPDDLTREARLLQWFAADLPSSGLDPHTGRLQTELRLGSLAQLDQVFPARGA